MLLIAFCTLLALNEALAQYETVLCVCDHGQQEFDNGYMVKVDSCQFKHGYITRGHEFVTLTEGSKISITTLEDLRVFENDLCGDDEDRRRFLISQSTSIDSHGEVTHNVDVDAHVGKYGVSGGVSIGSDKFGVHGSAGLGVGSVGASYEHSSSGDKYGVSVGGSDPTGTVGANVHGSYSTNGGFDGGVGGHVGGLSGSVDAKGGASVSGSLPGKRNLKFADDKKRFIFHESTSVDSHGDVTHSVDGDAHVGKYGVSGGVSFGSDKFEVHGSAGAGVGSVGASYEHSSSGDKYGVSAGISDPTGSVGANVHGSYSTNGGFDGGVGGHVGGLSGSVDAKGGASVSGSLPGKRNLKFVEDKKRFIFHESTSVDSHGDVTHSVDADAHVGKYGVSGGVSFGSDKVEVHGSVGVGVGSVGGSYEHSSSGDKYGVSVGGSDPTGTVGANVHGSYSTNGGFDGGVGGHVGGLSGSVDAKGGASVSGSLPGKRNLKFAEDKKRFIFHESTSVDSHGDVTHSFDGDAHVGKYGVSGGVSLGSDKFEVHGSAGAGVGSVGASYEHSSSGDKYGVSAGISDPTGSVGANVHGSYSTNGGFDGGVGGHVGGLSGNVDAKGGASVSGSLPGKRNLKFAEDKKRFIFHESTSVDSHGDVTHSIDGDAHVGKYGVSGGVSFGSDKFEVHGSAGAGVGSVGASYEHSSSGDKYGVSAGISDPSGSVGANVHGSYSTNGGFDGGVGGHVGGLSGSVDAKGGASVSGSLPGKRNLKFAQDKKRFIFHESTSVDSHGDVTHSVDADAHVGKYGVSGGVSVGSDKVEVHGSVGAGVGSVGASYEHSSSGDKFGASAGISDPSGSVGANVHGSYSTNGGFDGGVGGHVGGLSGKVDAKGGASVSGSLPGKRHI